MTKLDQHIYHVWLLPLPVVETNIEIPSLNTVVGYPINENRKLALLLWRPVVQIAHRFGEEREKKVCPGKKEPNTGNCSEDRWIQVP